MPAARAGAAMVFDPERNKMLLFGGRAASGYNYEDLWEWDVTTGTWTERSGTGKHPAARAQHAMLYQKSTGKILLFGGGRSNLTTDGMGVSASFDDTWELDPATGSWTELAPTSRPSVRHDFGLVWDSKRNVAVLFGGMQIDIPGATGVLKQDTWEWDPSAQTWAERATTGSKPVQRYGHAMAYDAGRGKVVVFGGSDMQTAGIKNDMWEWDCESGTWTQVLTGTEAGIPGIRTYSSLLYDGTRARLTMFAGLVPTSNPDTGFKGVLASNEIWEIDPSSTLAFTNRTVAFQGPDSRAYHAMAYDPIRKKTYVYGGADQTRKGFSLTDLWAWDGSRWERVGDGEPPAARVDAALAYDPARQSLILFGGNSWMGTKIGNETWEWSEDKRMWTQLSAAGPSPRWGHGMVTDMARKKVLLYGGSGSNQNAGKEVWEWDGATLTWTDRTPAPTERTPVGRNYPVMSFDEARARLVLYDGARSPSVEGETTSAYWEWDVTSGGWSLHDPGETLPTTSNAYAVYDPSRRRHVFFTDATVNSVLQTWELDANSETWYTRSLEVTPGPRFRSGMVFDSARRVAVVFGGQLNTAPGGPINDTWEYRVSNLANGQGCTAETTATCASGHCVDGVCCESAGCTGACMSCNVRGSEGKCVLAQAGTEVPGSCSDGQACDGTGACKSKNGQACVSFTDCASGFCVDNICCDSACGPTCKICNLPGRLGLCTPSPAGSDPRGECSQGTGVCKESCDGAGACAYPLGLTCGTCLTCDGLGACTHDDPSCGKGGSGGNSGKDSSYTKPIPGSGGSGGITSSSKGGNGGSNGGSISSNGGGISSSGGGITSSSKGGSAGIMVSSGGGGIVSSSSRSGGSGGGGIVSSRSSNQGGSGGSSSTGSATLARDAGASPDAAGSAPDAGDAGAPDGGLVGKLGSRGCGCDVGQAETRYSPSLLWTLLGASLLAWRSRRRQRNR